MEPFALPPKDIGSPATPEPCPLKNLEWWNWEETKKEIASSKASRARRRRAAYARQPLPDKTVLPAAILQDLHDLPVLEVHPKKKSLEKRLSASTPTTTATEDNNNVLDSPLLLRQTPKESPPQYPHHQHHSRESGIKILGKYLSSLGSRSSSIATEPTAVTQSSSSPASTPSSYFPARRSLSDAKDNLCETSVSLGRKWNLAKLPVASQSPKTLPPWLLEQNNGHGNDDDDDNMSPHSPGYKWKVKPSRGARLNMSSLSSTETDDDGQQSGSSSSFGLRSSLLKLQSLRTSSSSTSSAASKDRWFVRPNSILETTKNTTSAPPGKERLPAVEVVYFDRKANEVKSKINNHNNNDSNIEEEEEKKEE